MPGDDRLFLIHDSWHEEYNSMIKNNFHRRFMISTSGEELLLKPWSNRKSMPLRLLRSPRVCRERPRSILQEDTTKWRCLTHDSIRQSHHLWPKTHFKLEQEEPRPLFWLLVGPCNYPKFVHQSFLPQMLRLRQGFHCAALPQFEFWKEPLFFKKPTPYTQKK